MIYLLLYWLSLFINKSDSYWFFITKAKKAGMNEFILKLIVGHKITDLTENVYTHRDINELKKEMLKIKS